MNHRLLTALSLLSFSALAAPSTTTSHGGRPVPTPSLPATTTTPDDTTTEPAFESREAFFESAVRRTLPRLDAPGEVTSVEPRFGVPKFFRTWPHRNAPSLADAGVTPKEAALRHLATYAALYRLTPQQLLQVEATHVHDLKDGGAVIVKFQQRIGGVPVFRDGVSVVMNAKLQLVAFAGYLPPVTRLLGEFKLTDTTALELAVTELNRAPLHIEPLNMNAGGWAHFQIEGASSASRARAVHYALPHGLMPAYQLDLDVPGAGMFSYVVSAIDGEVLSRHDRKLDAFTYRVWADATPPYIPWDGPHGLAATPHVGSPNTLYDGGVIEQQLVTLDHAGLSTGDPWLAPGSTTTIGNNVHAYTDRENRNSLSGGNITAITTSADTFDYVYDGALTPTANETQQRAAVAQLFFTNNFLHDWFYDVGFDEAAGNAQVNNYGRGGLGGDPLRTEAQDGSGNNNASMQPRPDGLSCVMQMHLWTGMGAGANPRIVTVPNVLGNQGVTVAGTATFGPQNGINVTGSLMLVNDSDATLPDGGTGTLTDGCTDPAGWVGDYAGKVVLIDRGECEFAVKAVHAQTAGAAALIIANNTGQRRTPMPIGGVPSEPITIPVFGVPLTNGNNLKNALDAGTAMTATLTWNPPFPHDGTIDNTIVAHEWGHYISSRLIGDAEGLSTTQARGLGEGWSDFHAQLMVVRESDTAVAGNDAWQGAYGLAAWAGAVDDARSYYWGIRRYPMSIDLGKNPLMFRHIAQGQGLPGAPSPNPLTGGSPNYEVHATGEVWAVMLWEVYVELLKLHDFAEAQLRMRKYLVGGYKATPVNPTFVDARDGILAVIAAADATDYQQAWAAFARRGLGMRAVAPPADSRFNTPITESMDVGNEARVTQVTLDDSGKSCDDDGSLDQDETGALHVTVRNTGVGTLNGATVTIEGGAAVNFPSGAQQALPQLEPYETTTLHFPVELNGVTGAYTQPFAIIIAEASLLGGGVSETEFSFRVNADVVELSTTVDNVEAPTTWTVADDESLPAGPGSRFSIIKEDDGNHLWFGPNAGATGDATLTSPVMIAGATPPLLSFRHRFDFEEGVTFGGALVQYDGAVIEARIGDGDWQPIDAPGYNGTIQEGSGFFASSNPLAGREAYSGKSPGYPAMVTEFIDLPAAFANSAFQVRFRIGSDQSGAATGWDIDDIEVEGLDEPPFSQVVADPNHCVNAPPVLVVPKQVEVEAGKTASIVAVVSDPTGEAVTLTWNFEGAEVEGVTTGNTYIFKAPTVDKRTAEFTVKATATDARGASVSASTKVIVTNPESCGCTSLASVVPWLGVLLALRSRRRAERRS